MNMSDYSITQQPTSTNSLFTLLPDEYIRLEYQYKPGCCCFSTKITTITNLRLITRTIKTPRIFSKKTSTGKEKNQVIFLTNINNVKQIESAIPLSQNKWWMKCLNIFTCTCLNQQIDWLELCRGNDNLTFEINESTIQTNDNQDSSLVEKF